MGATDISPSRIASAIRGTFLNNLPPRFCLIAVSPFLWLDRFCPTIDCRSDSFIPEESKLGAESRTTEGRSKEGAIVPADETSGPSSYQLGNRPSAPPAQPNVRSGKSTRDSIAVCRVDD